MFRFGFFLFVMAGWGLAGAALYLVRSPEGFTLVTKDHLTFTDTWADTREWKKRDLAEHRELVARLVGANRAERALGHVVAGGDRDEIKGAIDEEPAMSRVWKKASASAEGREGHEKSARGRVSAGELLDLAMGN